MGRIGAMALVLSIGSLALPVQATEWMYCSDATNAVGIDMLFGQADTIYLDSFILRYEDQVWASNTAVGPGDPISAAQWFGDADHFDADFVDGGGALLAEVRLRSASEGELLADGGTLRIVGRGAWAISCPGAE